jgi:hypothetical protein
VTQRVLIFSDSVQLEGQLTIPNHAMGVVLFARGSHSSRLSPRKQFIAGSQDVDIVVTGTMLTIKRSGTQTAAVVR